MPDSIAGTVQKLFVGSSCSDISGALAIDYGLPSEAGGCPHTTWME